MPDRAGVTRLFNAVWYEDHPAGILLRPFGFLVGLLARGRRAAYRHGMASQGRVGCPVVVIGNLTVGGTGKTPFVIWLVRALAAAGLRPGIVSRGYGASSRSGAVLADALSDAAEVGDEAVLLARETGAPVAVGHDRLAAARLVVSAAQCDLVVSDDGLQHLRLARDFEVVIVDGSRGFGNGRCLPAGPLREPLDRLESVDAIVVNGDGATIDGAIRVAMEPVEVQLAGSPETRSLSEFRGRRAHAVAAIGNPGRFFDDLTRSGIDVIPHAHPDHAVLPMAAFDFGDGIPVLTTAKDAVKYSFPPDRNVWIVRSELKFRDGADRELLGRITALQDAGGKSVGDR